MRSIGKPLSNLALLLAMFVSTAIASAAAVGDPLRTTLEQSRDAKQGVTLIVAGRDVAMVVTEIGADFVVGKNQQHDRIVVRIDRIDAAMK